MDHAVADGAQRVFQKTAFVERVGVDGDLHIHLVGHAHAAVDGSGRGTPVLVQFQAHGTGTDLLAQRFGLRGIALAEQADVDGQCIGGLQHAGQMPGAGRAGGGTRALHRSRSATDHGGHAPGQCLVDLLGGDEVDVGVDAPRSDDAPFGRDDLGRGTDGNGHAGLDVRIAGLSDGGDAAVLHADVGLDDAPVIDDQGIGQHQIHDIGGQLLALPHAITDDLATPEFHFLAIEGEVLFDFDPQIGIGQTHAVAHGGAEHVGIGATGNAAHDSSAPITRPAKP